MRFNAPALVVLSVLLLGPLMRPAEADLIRRDSCDAICAAFRCPPSKTAACVAACQVGLPPACPDCKVRCRAMGCEPGNGLEDCAKQCDEGFIDRGCGGVTGCNVACSGLGCDQSQFDDCLRVCAAGGVPVCGPKHGCEIQCNALRGTTNNGCESDEVVDACIANCKSTGHAACGASDCPDNCITQGCTTRKDFDACISACQATGQAACGSGSDCLTRCTRTTRCWFPNETRACLSSCEAGHDAMCGGESCEESCEKEHCSTPKLTQDCVENCRTRSRAYCGGSHNCQAECNFQCELKTGHACIKGCEATGLILCGGKDSCMAWCTALNCPPDRVPACVAQCKLDETVTCPPATGSKGCEDSCKKSGCETPDECAACAKGCQNQIDNPGRTTSVPAGDSGGGSSVVESGGATVSNASIEEIYRNAHRTDLSMQQFFDGALQMTSGQTIVYAANMGLKLPDGDLDTEVTFTDGSKDVHPFDRGLLNGAPSGAQVLVCCPWPCSMAQQTCYNQLASYKKEIKSIKVIPHPGVVAAAINPAKARWAAAVKKAVEDKIAQEEATQARVKVETDAVLARLDRFADRVGSERQNLVSDPDLKDLFGDVPVNETTGETWGHLEVGAKTVREGVAIKARMSRGIVRHFPRWPCRGHEQDTSLGKIDESDPDAAAKRLAEKMVVVGADLRRCARDARSLAERARRLRPKIAAFEAGAQEFKTFQQQAASAFPPEVRRHSWETGPSIEVLPEPPKPPQSGKPTEVVLGQDYEQYTQVAQALADWPSLVEPLLQRDRLRRLAQKEQEQTFAIEKAFAEDSIYFGYGPDIDPTDFYIRGTHDLESTARVYDKLAQALDRLAEVPAGPDLEEQASSALTKLAQAYNLKQRSAFMKLVSDDFLGDTMALEDALLKDFRSYRSVNLDIITDNVQVRQGARPGAIVVFHYNLTVVNDQGVNQKFSGATSYTFLWEKGQAKLYQMSPPLIFGNSLPAAQNPVASSQGSSPFSSGSAPGGGGGTSTATKGSGEMSSNTDGSAGSGFVFRTQADTFDSTGADIFLSRQIGACSGLPCLNSAGKVQSIGSCDLNTLSSVPASMSGSNVTITVGACYGVQTADSHYAAVLVRVIRSIPGGTVVDFDFLYQPNGSNSFR